MTCEVPWLLVTQQPEWSETRAKIGESYRSIDTDKVLELHSSGMSTTDISRELGISHTYIYKIFEDNDIKKKPGGSKRPLSSYKTSFTREQAAHCIDMDISAKEASDQFGVSRNLVASALTREKKRRKLI